MRRPERGRGRGIRVGNVGAMQHESDGHAQPPAHVDLPRPQADAGASTVSALRVAPDRLRFFRGSLAGQAVARRGLPGWCADVVQWAILIGLSGAAWPAGGGSIVFFAVFGAALGFVLYRTRPAARWVRGLVVTGVPTVLAVLLCWSFAGYPMWAVPLVMLPAADIGARIAELRERSTGIKRSALARDWAGVDAVGDRDGVWFDVRPLNASVSRAEQREFRRVSPRTEEAGLGPRLAYVTFAVVVMPLGIFAVLFGMAQEISEHHDDMVGELIAMSAILSLMVIGWVVLIWWSGAARARRTSSADHLRLAQFAVANGFEYLPGPVTWRGYHLLTRVLRAPAGNRGLVIANREGPRRGHSASAAEQREAGVQTTHFGAICEVELAASMPHIWLHSTHHRAPAFAASTAPNRSQRLSLEGDFDRHFELYCPRGYERDALYLFTPDVMAWLVDDVRGFDVELIENRLVFRSRNTLVTRDPEDWAYLARALQTVRARIVQWERWRDDRVDAAEAILELHAEGTGAESGAGGRRLRLGIGAGAILIGVYGGVFVLLTLLANAL